MAETLTYDAGTDTVTEGDALTPAEQQALEVGEALEQSQDQLLAGKYRDAQELEKAYVELQKKLGEEGDKDSGEVGDTQDNAEVESQEAETETSETEEASEFYLEDGSLNYDAVNEAYGENLGNIFKEGNVDPIAISEHFHETKGSITEDMYKELEGAGLSRASIDSYLAGRAVESGYKTSEQEAADLTDKAISEVKEFAGGEDAYDNMVQWASQNVDKGFIEAFDDIIGSGSVNAIKLAVAALRSEYQNSNGYEGKMYTGKAPQASKDNVFRSQAELVAAMGDKRYDNDPAYRQDVIEKLQRSDNLEF